MEQDQIKRLHCGLISTPFDDAVKLMPELKEVLLEAPREPGVNYFVDVKVHMLMPNQYPCIPNWHYDFVPRDGDGNKMFDKRDASQKMFLWLSGPPFTEFRDGRDVKPKEWIEFTQFDEHRGVMSESFQWRVFIRITPEALIPFECYGSHSLRRHAQVYLNADNFEW